MTSAEIQTRSGGVEHVPITPPGAVGVKPIRPTQPTYL